MSPALIWGEDRKERKMRGSVDSRGQRLPCQYDGAATLPDGLSIRGAAVRRRQALEHSSLKEPAAMLEDQRSAVSASHMEITGVSSPDALTINTAEIASVGQQSTTSKPTSTHHPIETPETSIQTSTGMPSHYSPEHSRKDANTSNPAKPLAYKGVHGPNSIQSQHLQAYNESKESSMGRRLGGAADASSSHALAAWVQEGEWFLPGDLDYPDAYHKKDSAKNRRDLTQLPPIVVAEPYRTVLRDQSTNFPPLPTPNAHRGPQGLLPDFKEPSKSTATQPVQKQTPEFTPPQPVQKQTPEEDSGRQVEGPVLLSRATVTNTFNQRLATNWRDFSPLVSATFNNPRQPLPSQTQSPLSTNRVGEEASPQIQKDIVSPAPANSGPPTSVQQDRTNTSGSNVNEGQDVVEPHQDSAGSPESDESVRGQSDDAHLSSIPESMFFEHAYNGRDASVASEVVFGGRKPPNPYKTPKVTNNIVPGWEGFEVPVYQPGQLVGWDGNWQEAPVEWGRRDSYDYTADEHQQNVKNFIDDRQKQYDTGRCPPLEIAADEVYMKGFALATGYNYFAKPIPKEEPKTKPPDDPYSLGKATKTAVMAIESYLRVHARRLKEEENRANKVVERKNAAKAQRAEQQAEQQAREQEIAETVAAPNPYQPKLNIFIRPAEPKDIPQIREIHNSYIRDSAATGERVELTEREWRTRFDTCREDRFPFLVAILARYSKMMNRRQGRIEHVVGFSYIEDFAGEVTMWCHTCELQIFVHDKYLHQGVGKNLMDCILRGVNPTYQARNAVEFIFPPGDIDRYEGGGVRVIQNIIFPLPYTAEEDAKSQWVGQWLEFEFEFKLQGLLVGIGRYQGRR
ncbi:MAG: hypothetical protein Q9168_000115 [Polycauliona sp. 1 TL-2023]